jgi:uncharacterized membrane protein YqaE (UPF0057 family)
MLTALVILCPPLAVLLTAPSSSAAKNLGLTLLLYVPGVLHARRVVESYTVNRRYDSLMRQLEARDLRIARTQAA